jgi:hypothetical protein
MAPLSIEVLTYAPTEFFHCMHCEVTMQAVGLGQAVHREQRAAAFPPDLQAAYEALGDWVRDLCQRHGDRVAIRIVDAASLEGVYKSLRYRTRRYPTVVIGGTVYRDADYAALTRVVDAAVSAAPVA